MQQIVLHRGQLQYVCTETTVDSHATFSTHLPAWDSLLPQNRWRRGAVHELLYPPDCPTGLMVAVVLAQAAHQSQETRGIVLSDPGKTLDPPGLMQLGLPLERVYFLHPSQARDEFWALSESLRCAGVSATIAQLGRFNRVQARRLQLSAEAGEGIGIFLRPFGSISQVYAAATRWLIEPFCGQRVVQRWKLTLLHSHGGRVGQSVLLEFYRETRAVRAISLLVDQLPAPTRAHA